MAKRKSKQQQQQAQQVVEPEQQEEISPDEMERQEAQELPDRENTSLVNLNVAAPINAAAALNVLSDGSIAYADAEQTTPITQST